jgi:hypothetical protein
VSNSYGFLYLVPSFGPWLCPSDNAPDANPDPTSDRPSDGPDFRPTFSPTFSRRGYCKNYDHVSFYVAITSFSKISDNISWPAAAVL